MLGTGRAPSWRSRLQAVRQLYRNRRDERRPEFRGRRLLLSWLSASEREQLERNGYFDIVGGASGKRYRIHYGTCANIQEIDQSGRPRVAWCFVPVGSLVAGDVMLAQKIAIETDEAYALSVANQLPRNATPCMPNGCPF